MASSIELSLLLLLASSLVQLTFAEVICENLPENMCGFAVASSGKRCVLENYKKGDGSLVYTCKTSEVVAERFSGHIESDQCVSACGADRRFIGISSDDLATVEFTNSLCSPACSNNCPNILDLYYNLAAGEGVFLPDLCKKSHREMLGLQIGVSVGGVSVGATVDVSTAPTPASAPAPF